MSLNAARRQRRRPLPTPRHLANYLGLNPTVRQSGNERARHGRISKQGAPLARHALVKAAWHAGRTAGPLRAFWQRVAMTTAVLSPAITRAIPKLGAPSTAESCQTLPTPLSWPT